MRRYYLDNLRWVSIMFLFPIHTAVLYAPKGSHSFVFNSISENNGLLSFFLAITPTLMGLLFLIAGVTTGYSLNKRSYGQYVVERTKKLLIPFVTGITTIVPFMYYIVSLQGVENKGFIMFMTSYLSDILGVVTKCEHLWFILCLYIVSILALIFIYTAASKNLKISINKMPMVVIILLGVPYLLLGKFIEFGATVTLSGAFILLLIGYFFFRDNAIEEKLVEKSWFLVGVFILLTTLNIIINNAGYQTTIGMINYKVSWLFPYFGLIIQWFGILAVLSIGRKYLEFNNKFTKYFSEASFAIYIFHYPGLILAAFIFAPLVKNQLIQFLIINGVGFIFCILTYEVVRRIPGVRLLFGISKKAT
ncbi:MAG: acyltransferase family protein [Clostridium sp.]|uniref:acyltransferase family protein n=1 Tax=Clostridium sp. TaxID=1506 RepID=UPI002FC7C4F9